MFYFMASNIKAQPANVGSFLLVVSRRCRTTEQIICSRTKFLCTDSSYFSGTVLNRREIKKQQIP